VPEWRAIPDRDAWHTFFNIRFPPAPKTLFKDVFKIPPGCYLLLQRGKKQQNGHSLHKRINSVTFGEWKGAVYQYYQLPSERLTISFDDAENHLKTLFQNSIDGQMVADVPVGVYLSGGIDSSAITAFASKRGSLKINTFCMGFGESADENRHAAIVAKQFQTVHNDVILDENPLDSYKHAIFYMEEPKVNCLQGFLLAREAVKKQKVVLSGLGGDELFGGYDIYELALWIDLLRNKHLLSMEQHSGKLLKRLLQVNGSLGFDLYRRGADLLAALSDPLNIYLLLRNGWDHDFTFVKKIYQKGVYDKAIKPVREHFVNSFPSCDSLAEAFMHFEFQNKMVDDFLANEDRMSMANSLEVRVPFLDRNIVEFAKSLPIQWKMRLGRRKIIFKNLLSKMLPSSIINRRKHGFTFNPVLQAQKDLISLARTYLTQSRVEESGVFNFTYLKNIMRSQPHPNLRWHYFLLWKILGYFIWEELFIKGNGVKPS